MFYHFKPKSELCTKGVKRDGKAGLSLNDILCPVLTLLRMHSGHVNFSEASLVERPVVKGTVIVPFNGKLYINES